MINFNSRIDVNVNPVILQEHILRIITENMLLIRIAGTRSASDLLKKQVANMKQNENIEVLNQMKALVDQGLEALKSSEIDLGDLLHRTWTLKKKLSLSVTNIEVDQLYMELIQQGFYGGKLLGAGANGYLLMVGSQTLVQKTHNSRIFHTLRLQVDNDGAKIIYTS
jgi:D-glycero-alpha-D-manno-heptose-7-phosphate kinase